MTNSSSFQLPALYVSPKTSLVHIVSNVFADDTARRRISRLLKFPNSIRGRVWQVGFDECGVELQHNSQPHSELSVAAFCWYKMLIGAIRGEIWSLFNTERRISEIERRGGEGRGGWEIETELRDRNIGD
jgi:hypothetical protein